MTRTHPSIRKTSAAVLVSLSLAASLCGCSTAFVRDAGTEPIATPSELPGIKGSARGGQQPVSGATIQLYEVSTTGYAGIAQSLLPAVNPVVTDANGSFNITGAYMCDPGALVYITATGGNPGLSGNNRSLALMTALGPCSSLSASTFISINELTTVASVYALAQFFVPGPGAGTPTAVEPFLGTTPTNISGITQAFADVNQLVNVNTGTAPGPALPAGGSFSVAELNTLANTISSCVNSSGYNLNAGNQCSALFNLALSASGSLPSDTITAVMNIVLNPSANVQALFDLAPSAAPFQPALAAAPADWTLALNYSAGGMAGPSSLAIDASGNVWIANRTGDSVSELTHAGVPVVGSPYTGALSAPSSIAVDQNGYVWVANSGTDSLAFFSNGLGAPPQIVTGGGLKSPSALAFDSKGDNWVANSGANVVTGFSNAQTPLSMTGFAPSGLLKPLGIAISPH